MPSYMVNLIKELVELDQQEQKARSRREYLVEQLGNLMPSNVVRLSLDGGNTVTVVSRCGTEKISTQTFPMEVHNVT